MALSSFFPGSGHPVSRFIRLSIEPLDSRETPSPLTVSSAPGQDGQNGPERPGNVAPTISDLRAIVGPHGQVTFAGTVSDDQPVAGYVVHITGDGVDVSGVVQKDGTFAVTTTVSGTSDITVMAQVTDRDGATSDPVYTTFTPSA
jgi:sugar/nucleoside kinase (ribokinase family)